MKTEKYFIEQIKGLMIILEEGEGAIARNYVLEKLKMILNGGINFHPIIKEKLEEQK